MFLLFLFIIGLALGSFLNVVILRLNTGENLRGRSRCFSCLRRLEWHDMVPIASYMAIRGRCRSCGSGISIQYPLVELAAAFLTVGAAYTMFGTSIPQELMRIAQYILVVKFLLILLAASVYDLRHKIIPDQLSLLLVISAVLLEGSIVWQQHPFYIGDGFLFYDIAAGLGAFTFFAGIWFISKGEWMGFGDAKIAFPIGLFLGFPNIVYALLAAFWSGAIIGVALLVSKRMGRKSEIPFAPFLALGTYIVFFCMNSSAMAWLTSFFVPTI
ncbi:MAG: prepilin peptidase [Patescibacteria group bacterium]